MQIGSKVVIKGSFFSHTYTGEIIGEKLESVMPVWIVLVQFSQLAIELNPVQSSFYKDTLHSIDNMSGFYIEEE